MHMLSFLLLTSQLTWAEGVLDTSKKGAEAYKKEAVDKAENANKLYASGIDKEKLARGESVGKDGSESRGEGGGGGGTEISASKRLNKKDKGGESSKDGRGEESISKKGHNHSHSNHEERGKGGGGGGGTVDQSTRERLLAEAREERREARRANREAQAYANAALMSMKTASTAGNYQPQSYEQQQLQSIVSNPNPYAAELDSRLAEHGIGLEEDEDEVAIAAVGFEESEPVTPELQAVKDNAEKQQRKPSAANSKPGDSALAPAVFGGTAFDPSFGPLGETSIEGAAAKDKASGLKTNFGYFKTGGPVFGFDKNEEIDLSELNQRVKKQAENQKQVRRALGLQEQSVQSEFHLPIRDIWDMIHLRYQAVTEKNRLNLEIKPASELTNN
jgi:hypothetical protein